MKQDKQLRDIITAALAEIHLPGCPEFELDGLPE